jgi:hypothetical protein
MPNLLAQLFDGPIDIVGDVHGEIDALRALLTQLGYSQQGEHPQGRRLVFLGDLCDRGPDSLAVIRLVKQMIERGLAQCLLGNHEMNILRNSPKSGNGWFFAHDHDRAQGRFMHSAPADESQRNEIQEFFATMPLTLQRDDLRLVHAAWLPDQLQLISQLQVKCDVLAVYHHFEDATEAQVTASGLKHAMENEYRIYAHSISDSNATVPLLPALALYDETYQMNNPVRVLTSGVEQRTATPFFTGGKWRMVQRVPWWQTYTDTVPVIVGHYWRWFFKDTRHMFGKGEMDLFEAYTPTEWVGAKRNVYCIDFSVGGRYKERELGKTSQWGTRLGAVRWPEQEVVFDEGYRAQLQPLAK